MHAEAKKSCLTGLDVLGSRGRADVKERVCCGLEWKLHGIFEWGCLGDRRHCASRGANGRSGGIAEGYQIIAKGEMNAQRGCLLWPCGIQ